MKRRRAVGFGALLSACAVCFCLFAADATEWYFLVKEWPEVPEGWNFDRPSAIGVDSDGNVFVSDSGNHRIQRFDSSGNFLRK